MDKTYIQPPVRGSVQVLMTEKLSLGRLLAEVLDYTGPARITVSTYSCGEEFLNRLVRLKNQGLVTYASLYCSHHAAEKVARLIALMHRAYDAVHYINNHSKVMVIEGRFETVCVLSSQNQTRGYKLENYTVINDSTSAPILLEALAAQPEAALWT